MSAYSLRDIEKAFKCAWEPANETEPIDLVQVRVVSHLEGNCPCGVDRCAYCGARPRNGVPRHLPTCRAGGEQ